MQIQAPLKDGNAEHAVADVWRPVIREIVKALADGDYSRIGEIPSVAPPEKKTVDQIREYLEDFGETLVELPDETWSSSMSERAQGARRVSEQATLPLLAITVSVNWYLPGLDIASRARRSHRAA